MGQRPLHLRYPLNVWSDPVLPLFHKHHAQGTGSELCPPKCGKILTLCHSSCVCVCGFHCMWCLHTHTHTRINDTLTVIYGFILHFLSATRLLFVFLVAQEHSSGMGEFKLTSFSFLHLSSTINVISTLSSKLPLLNISGLSVDNRILVFWSEELFKDNFIPSRSRDSCAKQDNWMWLVKQRKTMPFGIKSFDTTMVQTSNFIEGAILINFPGQI